MPAPGNSAVRIVGVAPKARRMALRAAWIAVALVLLAAVAWINLRYSRASFTVRSAGKLAGLLAAALFMVQFALSARIKPLDRAFALNNLLKLHAALGATAAVLAFLHPLLLYTGGGQSLGKLSLSLWPEGLGALAILLVALVVATSIFRTFLELSFEAWRRIHQLVFLIVLVVAIHSLELGSDLNRGWPRLFWWATLAGYAGLFVYVKFVKPRLLERAAWRVASVEPAARATWNLTLEPPSGGAFSYMPGQFAFLTISGKGLKREEHPFTISSAPSRAVGISFTIRESGDFTKTIGRAAPGDTATVDGPYGRFTHLVRGEGDLLMIAGGVGITPMLSMLRYMADTGDPRAVTLVWANRSQADIPFPEEVEGLSERLPGFRVHHVLSDDEGWQGRKGYVTEGALDEMLSADELDREVFLCGPPVMMGLVEKALGRLGVPRRRIRTERFAL